MNTVNLAYKQKLSILDTFVVSAVLTILGIRLFLEFTGYPQIGGNGLHIAHMLWGGFGLTIACLVLLLVENPNKHVVAFASGIGFGFFIDEIGKFVTSDNNYFFKPSAFLMYVVILMIWLVSRVLIVRKSGGQLLSPAEWPKQSYWRRAIVVWVVVNIVTGIVAVITAFFSGTNILGITNELSEFMPTLIAIVSLIYILGLIEYRMRKLASAARTIRTGALVSAVAVYPFTFYGQQFSAAIGCIVTIITVIALSEASLKEIARPIFGIFRKSS